MKKLKFLTVRNKAKLYRVLKGYLLEVIQDEEYLDSMDKVVADVVRVKCYKTSPRFTVHKVEEYLRGLSLHVMYSTYDICKFLFSILNLDYDRDNNKFIEEAWDIDAFYWECLAQVIFSYYLRKGGM